MTQLLPLDAQLRPGLSYAPCRYGESRLLFRGPRRPVEGRYIACLGASETFGRFLPTTIAGRIEEQTGLAAINLGQINASVDAFLHDLTVMEIAKGAAVTVIEVMSAANLSNRFYSVHPRRNDRFVRASSVMSAIFPQTDFSEFCFTHAMLRRLQATAPDRFPIVLNELQQAWFARMRTLIAAIGGPVVLLWMAPRLPTDRVVEDPDGWPWMEPLFVTKSMIDRLQPLVQDTVVIGPSIAGVPGDGLVLDDADQAAAAGALGLTAQSNAAAALTDAIRRLVNVPAVA